MILLCISCIICPTIYVNKHLSRLTYGRAPAKGSNHVVTRNRRILSTLAALNQSHGTARFCDYSACTGMTTRICSSIVHDSDVPVECFLS